MPIRTVNKDSISNVGNFGNSTPKYAEKNIINGAKTKNAANAKHHKVHPTKGSVKMNILLCCASVLFISN